MKNDLSDKQAFISLTSKDNPNLDTIWDLLQNSSISHLTRIFKKIDELSLNGEGKELASIIRYIMLMQTDSPIMVKRGMSIYRSRKHTQSEDSFHNLIELTYRNKEKVLSLGRLNDIYQPIYYAARNISIAVLETTLESAENEPEGYCTVVKSNLASTHDLQLSNLYPLEFNIPMFPESHEALKCTYQQDKFLREHLGEDTVEKMVFIRNYIAERIVAKMSNPNFDCYRITSTIAKTLYNGFGSTGIIYPTVALDKSHSCLALLPETYDNNFTPVEVLHIKYNYLEFTNNGSSGYEGTCMHTVLDNSRNINSNGNIEWGPCIANKDSCKVTFKSGVTNMKELDKPQGNRLCHWFAGGSCRYSGPGKEQQYTL